VSRWRHFLTQLTDVKANLLLTHFGNFKWTHPECERKQALLFATNLRAVFAPEDCAKNGKTPAIE
jgi:hypothetical protein